MTSSEGMQQYDDVGGPWQWGNLTWRRMAAHGLVRVELVQWIDGTVMVESSREPFMAPSVYVPCKPLGGGEMEERNIHFVSLLQGVCRC